MPRRNAKKGPGSIASTPGQLYGGISAFGEEFDPSESETVLGREKDPWYVTYCKRMRKRFPGFAKNAKMDEAHEDAIKFLGWRMNAADFVAGLKGTAVIGFIPAMIFIALFYLFGIGLEIGEFNSASIIGGGLLSRSVPLSLSMNIFMGISIAILGAVGALTYYIYSYPIGAAKEEKNLSLTYVPEMIGYMIMSMKLVPNLEKAIEFSAKHGKGKIALEFKRLIWDFQIGVYNSISEGVDALAYRWGKYSEELKESLMKIRASVMEPSESHRYQLLDKTMLDVLESVKGTMEDYARSLNQPSVMLFYLGVLLPLILIIILPVGSAFSGTALANPIVLALIYCLGIPMIAFLFAKKVVRQRPPTYEPPVINDGFAELPKKWHIKMRGGSIDGRIIFAIIIVVGLFVSFFVSVEGIPPKSLVINFMGVDSELVADYQLIGADRDLGQILLDSGQDPNYLGMKVVDLYFVDYYNLKQGQYYLTLVDEGVSESKAELMAMKAYVDFTNDRGNDPTKYLFWAGLILTFTYASAVLLYYKNIYKRNAQLKIIQMEEEFKESMYVIASRMGENKPVESALKQAREFLPNLLVSKRIFGKTVENIELMGLPLEGAVFDPIYGSMKGIPSKVLRTAMRLLVDSVSLGVEVASRTLMSLSLQMENMDKVNKSLKDMVSDVSQTMLTMSLFVGPIVLGITVALQKVVMTTLAGVVSDPAVGESTTASMSNIIQQSGGTEIGSFLALSVDKFLSLANPLVFLIIIAIYVAEIVVIMIFFTTKVQEDNNLLFKINLAKALPIAVTIFVITALGANMAVSAML